MKKLFSIISAVFLFFGFGMSADAAIKNIFFSSSASSGGNGSLNSPYDDLSDLSWSIVQSWVRGGDTVYLNLKRGSSFSEEWNIGASGVSGRPITIQAYDSGNKPVITGSSQGIDSYKKDYIDVDNIAFTRQSHAGIRLINCEKWNITNCDFTNGNGGDGIRIETDIGDGNSGPFLIQGCIFDDLDQGIYNTYETGAGAGEHVVGLTIDSCSFHDMRMAYQDYNGTDKNNFNACSATGRMTRNFVVTNNTVDKMTTYAFNAACQGGTNKISGNVCTNIGDGTHHTNTLQIGASWDLTIENNVIDGANTVDGDGHGIILDHQPRGNTAQDCLRVHVRNNLIKNCNDPDGTCAGIKIWDAKDSYIYGNIIVNCTVGISIAKIESVGNKYYNNTIYNPGSYCVDLWGDSSSSSYSVPDTWWYNNVFYGGSYAFHVGKGATIPTESNNLHYRNTWSNRFSKDVTSINADPLFTNAMANDFSLKAGSPAIGAGRDLGSIYSAGIHPDSNWRATPLPIVKIAKQGIYGEGWEIGAYVFIEGSSNLSGEVESPRSLKILSAGE